MLKYVPQDIIKLIINFLLPNNLINLRVTNKENKELVKLYSPNIMIYITKSINIIKIFPNIKSISIRPNVCITDGDFSCLNNIEELDLSNCSQIKITDNSFRHLMKIKRLNLLGYKQTWVEDNYVTNKSFDYLSNLETLEIDDNYVINDSGLQKLKKIKHLYIYNCNKITDNGISNLINLEKLGLYSMENIIDLTFKKLNKLQELVLTDCQITNSGLKYLSNLTRLKLVNVKNINWKDFDQLNIKELYLSQINITDCEFIYLKNIRLLMLYYLKINGSGLKYLTNIQKLIINQSYILDEHLDNLYYLKKLEEIHIYDCYYITKPKINELKLKFGNKLYDCNNR
jgi:hypothetical protein